MAGEARGRALGGRRLPSGHSHPPNMIVGYRFFFFFSHLHWDSGRQWNRVEGRRAAPHNTPFKLAKCTAPPPELGQEEKRKVLLKARVTPP